MRKVIKLSIILSFLYLMAGCRTMGSFTPNIGPTINVNGHQSTLKSSQSVNEVNQESLQDQTINSVEKTYLSIFDEVTKSETKLRNIDTDLILYENKPLTESKLLQTEVIYGKLTEKNCEYVYTINIPAKQQHNNNLDLMYYSKIMVKTLRLIAINNNANRVELPNLDYLYNQIKNNEKVSVRAYKCGEVVQGSALYSQLNNARATKTISLFAGQYIQRHGFLESLGKKVPTFGFEIDSFFLRYKDGVYQRANWGGYLLWSFDHYLNTDSKFLDKPFKGKDFTSYFISMGGIYRYEINEKLYAQYNLGMALNFNEIDTFGNDSQNDKLYTDTSYSMVHKVGIFYGDYPKSRNWTSPGEVTAYQYGVSALYYYSPDLLGKFFNVNAGTPRDPGGSWSLVFEIKWEHL